MSWHADPMELIAVWNALMVSHGLARWEANRQIMDEARVFGVWCVENMVDPERYMRARFDAIGWRHRLAFRQLASPKFLAKFRDFGDLKQAAAVSEERGRTDVVDDTPRDGSKPIVMWEQAKRRFALTGDYDLCRISGPAFTGGFVASSVICKACPVAVECASDRRC